MSKIGKGPQFEQGEGRANRQGSSGSKFAQGEGRANRQGASGSHLAQGEGRAVSGKASGSHLEQHPSNKTGKHAPQRGGHSREGYDHGPSPSAGKSKSGSHLKQPTRQ